MKRLTLALLVISIVLLGACAKGQPASPAPAPLPVDEPYFTSDEVIANVKQYVTLAQWEFAPYSSNWNAKYLGNHRWEVTSYYKGYKAEDPYPGPGHVYRAYWIFYEKSQTVEFLGSRQID